MNELTLAVAGGRKTESIVEHCRTAPAGRRLLVLTYTQANQRELISRLAKHRPLKAQVDVAGWFSFLLGYWIRPYLPMRFADALRLRGLNFDGDPGRYAKDQPRFLDSEGRAYKLHLGHLAMEVASASSGSVIDRLARIYDEIHIDEAQDLTGYDLEIVSELFESPIDVHMVGDVRQALPQTQTNPREPKNAKYKGVAIKQWFDEQATAGRLTIEEQATTWRSNQTIADFADSIFDESWAFPSTTSKNEATTEHDGVFVLAEGDVAAYNERYSPLCLRYNANSATHLDLPFTNIGMAKGLGVERVLIGPTGKMRSFVCKGKALQATGACCLYVGVTRARASVAFALPDPSASELPTWTP